MTIQFINKQKENFWLLIFAIGLISVIPSNVQAQNNSLKKGDIVKISVPSINKKTIIGRVIMSSDIVTALRVKKDSTYYVTNSLIEHIWISEGKKRNTGKGALIGLISGGLIFGIASAATNNPQAHPCKEVPSSLFCAIAPEFSNSEAFAIGAVVGILGGGTVGAIIGSMLHTNRWKRVPVNISFGVQPIPKIRGVKASPTLSLRLMFTN